MYNYPTASDDFASPRLLRSNSESSLSADLNDTQPQSHIPIVVKKPSHQDLPQLSIPLKTKSSRSSFTLASDRTRGAEKSFDFFTQTLDTGAGIQEIPETPPSCSDSPWTSTTSASVPITPNSSISSPIAGVVDLTQAVRTVSAGPVSHGGYSDIYQGELVVTTSDADGPQKLPVAIKLIRVLSSKGYDEVKARKRLNREVYVWHRLDHPNIASFLGTSYHMANRPALILPWFKNGSASEYLKMRNPDANRLRLILDVAEGLEYLHTHKPAPIVHGDLKGNNILIADDGHAILSDFGLSQVIEDLVGPTGITPSVFEAGPIRWQSPEFLMDVSETCRPQLPNDVWSFGCTAYELSTGNVPYHFRLRDANVIHDIHAGVPPPGVEENNSRRGDGGIWDLMNDCWICPPANRIRMPEVVSKLKEICLHSSSSPRIPSSTQPL